MTRACVDELPITYPYSATFYRSEESELPPFVTLNGGIAGAPYILRLYWHRFVGDNLTEEIIWSETIVRTGGSQIVNFAEEGSAFTRTFDGPVGQTFLNGSTSVAPLYFEVFSSAAGS